MSREHVDVLTTSFLDMLGIPLSVENAALSADPTNTADSEFDVPTWNETTDSVIGHISESVRPSEFRDATGQETQAHIDIWLPDSVTVTDGDGDESAKATRITEDSTQRTYKVVDVFATGAGILKVAATEV